MTQTRLGSFVEAWGNVALGFGVNFAANLLILPYFGFTTLTVRKNLEIGMLFTIVSVARSYAIRRWFNGFKFTWNVKKDAKELELGEEKEVGVPQWVGGDGCSLNCSEGHLIYLRGTRVDVSQADTTSPVYRMWCEECGGRRNVYSRFQPA